MRSRLHGTRAASRLDHLAAAGLLVAVALGLSPEAHAVPLRPVHPGFSTPGSSIDRAIGVFITHRGQSYFWDHLEDLVALNGYYFREGGFERFDYRAEEPVDILNLPVEYGHFRGKLSDVSQVIKRWFRGFSLENPLVTASAEGISYVVNFSRFGLRVDRDQTRALRDGRGVVVGFELEIPDARIDVQRIRGRDLNNDRLVGELGVDQFLAGFGPDERQATSATAVPLRIRIPIVAELNERDDLTFRVLDLETNLKEVGLQFSFARPLQLPRVEIIVNGRVMTLNQRRLEDELMRHTDKLLDHVKEYMADFAHEKVPAAINALVSERMPNGFNEVNEMDPPGAPLPVARGNKFKWGVKPQEVRVTRHFLHFGLMGFVEDPRSRDVRPASTSRTLDYPALNLVDPRQYDLALAINQDLFNRILGLSFRRRYFDRIELDGGGSLRLVRAPELRIDGTNSRNQAKLHLRISQNVTGIASWIVHSPLEFDVDVLIGLQKNAYGCLSARLHSIDERSAHIEDRYFKNDLFRGHVYRSVRDKLRETNRGLARSPKLLVEHVPIPSQIGGMQIRVKEFQSDPNGYLVVYLEYAPE